LRTYNKYILTLALCSGLVNSLLAFWGQGDLEIYFITNITVYLVVTLLYVYLNPRARRALSTIGIVLFGGFIVTVVLRSMEIMTGG